MGATIPPLEFHLAFYTKVQELLKRHYGPLLECTHSHPIKIDQTRLQLSRRQDEWDSWLKIDPHVWQSVWGEPGHTRVRIYNICYEVAVMLDVWIDESGEAVLRDNLPEQMRHNRALLWAA